MKKRTLLLTLFLFAFLTNLCATHNHAGAITYKQLDDNTIEASIITYTNLNSVAADRDSLSLCWGDGNCEWVLRVNGPDNGMNGIPDGEALNDFFKVNIYTTQHSYGEFGQYTLSMTDPNRSGGILNVNFPNSNMVPFYIETQFNLIPLSNGISNQSPVILEPPIIRAFKGLPFIYTPNAYDIDGDSIVYELTNPADVPNYQLPCEINTNPPGPNICTIDYKKGLFNWHTPQVVGDYVLAISVKSYREGNLIDEMILDFMITVEDDYGLLPEIAIGNVIVNEINPVNVGDTILMDIFVSDPNINDTIEINSSSGLYDYFDNPATFEAIITGNTGAASFEWIVLEEHVRQQPYQVVIKANDNDLDYSKTSFVAVCFQFEEFITSVQSPAKQLDFQLFPNPANGGFINLSLKNYFTEFDRFTIYDSNGQLIKTDKINAEQTQIDINPFPSGVYFLTVKGSKSTSTKSFVIQ